MCTNVIFRFHSSRKYAFEEEKISFTTVGYGTVSEKENIYNLIIE